MKSTWLLFKVFRRRLWICLFVEVVLIFLLAYTDISPRRPHSIQASSILSFILAALLSLWLCFPPRFNTMPFPVSIRQRAWLPLLGTAILWAGGCVAILVALLCLGVFWVQDFFFAAITPVPLYILGFLFVLRLFRTKPHMFSFLGFLGMSSKITDSSWYMAFADTYHLWWPAVFIAIAYYLYEAPIVLARRDRLLAGQTGNMSFFRMPDLLIATRRHPASGIGDMIEALVLLAIIILYCFEFLPRIIPIDSFGPGSVPFLLVFLFIILIFVSIFKSQYQMTTASGFSSASALWMTLIEMTIVLNPLAQAFGVKKGVVARCDQCAKGKFLWASHCPHCGNPGTGTIANKRLARFSQGKPIVPQRRVRFLLRMFIPLQFFFMFGFVTSSGNRPFVTYSAHVTFRDGENQQAQEQAVKRIQELVAEHSDPTAWIASAQSSDETTLQTPQKFRLEVSIHEGGNIWIRSYALRWDPAQALPGAVARRLTEEVQEIYYRSSQGPNKSFSRARIFQMRGYLDNRVHWVEPRK